MQNFAKHYVEYACNGNKDKNHHYNSAPFIVIKSLYNYETMSKCFCPESQIAFDY